MSKKKASEERSSGTSFTRFFSCSYFNNTYIRFFLFNLKLICTWKFLKTLELHLLKRPTKFQLLNKPLVQINSNSKGETVWSPIPINNDNRAERSPIQSVIILYEWSTKVDNREAGVRFLNPEYDYRLNWTTRCPVPIHHNNYNFPQKQKIHFQKSFQ